MEGCHGVLEWSSPKASGSGDFAGAADSSIPWLDDGIINWSHEHDSGAEESGDVTEGVKLHMEKTVKLGDDVVGKGVEH